MSDATPINRMLLFNSPLDFKASQQLAFGVQDASIFTTRKISSAALPQLSKRCMMIRNLDELRRLPEVMDAYRGTPRTPDMSGPQFPPVLPTLPTTTLGDDTESEGDETMNSAGTERWDCLPPLDDHADWEDCVPWDQREVSNTTHALQPTSAGASTSGAANSSSSGGVLDSSDLWRWPIEVLYQSYHVVVAIDFSKTTFELARNGCTFADRIPSAIQAILSSIRTTVETRTREVTAIREWAAQWLDPAIMPKVVAALWNPNICVSVVLVNTPTRSDCILHGNGVNHRTSSDHPSIDDDDDDDTIQKAAQRTTSGAQVGDGGQKAPNSSFTMPSSPVLRAQTGPYRKDPVGASQHSQGSAPRVPCDDGTSPPERQVPFFPTSFTPFGTLDDSSDWTVERTIPIIMKRPAAELLEDSTFECHLARLVLEYESIFRNDSSSSMESVEWPDTNISSTIEKVLRFVPFDSDDCHSLVVVSNFAVNGCSETISLLEGQVLRKNIILSCLSLNRFIPWDSPHLTPLGHFLISCGGFSVHMDQWVQLSDVGLSQQWCRRFEGPRCLSQQLFVHFISKFPVVAPGVSQKLHTIIPPIRSLPYLTETMLNSFDSGQQRSDFVLNTHSALQTLLVLAEARINEGWSVILDFNPRASSTVHLYARLDHFLHKGSLTLYYEVDIVLPVMYRTIRVQGTPALVRHFVNIRLDDRVSALSNQGSRTWHTYLVLLRSMLDSWMRADEMVLGLFNTAPMRPPPLKSILHASGLQGCMAEWFNRCAVHSTSLVLSLKSSQEKFFSDHYVSPRLKRVTTELLISKDPVLSMLKDLARKALAPLGFSPLAVSPPQAAEASQLKCPLVVGYSRTSAPMTDAEVQTIDLIQLFVVSDPASAQVEYLSVMVEVRFSFLQRTSSEQQCAMREVREAFTRVLATDTALTSTAEGICDDDAELTCVARRAMCMAKHELISSWSDASSAPTSGTAAERQGPNRRAGSKKILARGTKHTVQTITQRCFVLGAHGSELFFMNSTASVRWTFTCFAVRTNSLATTAMGLILLRRFHGNFAMMYATVGGKKSVFRKQQKFQNANGECVDFAVYDVVEMRLGEGKIDLSIVRHITKLDEIYQCNLRAPHMEAAGVEDPSTVTSIIGLTRDIDVDHTIFTAVHSFYVLLDQQLHATAPKASTADLTTTHLSDDILLNGRNKTIDPQLVSLLPYLHCEQLQVLEISAPTSCGSGGRWELERAIHHFVASLGDENIFVKSEDLRGCVTEMLHMDPNHGATTVLVVRLSPRHPSVKVMTVVVMACPPPQPHEALHVGRGDLETIRVAYGTVDISSLSFCLADSLGVKPPRDVVDSQGSHVHVQPNALIEDAQLLNSISNCLKAFATVVTARLVQKETILRSRRSDRHVAKSMAASLHQHPNSTPATPLQSPVAANSEAFGSGTTVFPAPPLSATSAITDDTTFNEVIRSFRGMCCYAREIDISYLNAMLSSSSRPSEDSPLQDDDDGNVAFLQQVNRVLFEGLDEGSALRRVTGSTSPTFFLDPHAKIFHHSAAAGSDGLGSPLDDSISVDSRMSGGVVHEMGALEAEQIPCLIKLLLTSRPVGEDGGGEVDRSGEWTVWVGPDGHNANVRLNDDSTMTSRLSGSNSFSECDAFGSSPTKGETAGPQPCIPVSATSAGGHYPSSCSSRNKLSLTLIIRTVPDALFDVSRNRYRPPYRVVRQLLRETIANNGELCVSAAPTKAAADFSERRSTLSRDDAFFDVCLDVATATEMKESAISVGRLPEVCLTVIERFMEILNDKVASYCLRRCLTSEPYQEIDHVLYETTTRGSPSSCRRTSASISNEGDQGASPVLSTGIASAVASTPMHYKPPPALGALLQQPDATVLGRLYSLKALHALIANVAVPSFLSSRKYIAQEFQVEFTRTSRRFDGIVDPDVATRHVFGEILERELICMVPLEVKGERMYFFVPSPEAHVDEILVVQLCSHDGSACCTNLIDSVRIYCFAPSTMPLSGVTLFNLGCPAPHHSSFAYHAVCEALKNRIYQKIVQVSQIHLLKELRDQQNASDEMIPPHWGDQFQSSQPDELDIGLKNATFMCKGSTVLEIPIYYKLQHQCKKIFSRIQTNCAKLELLTIYNREQCFVVADDQLHDTFHFIRLVFAKSVSQIPHPSQFPQIIQHSSDRCQVLAVQLYAADPQASITSVLNKLQDICYLLALQELQSHLNFVQRKDLHSDDWLFLRYEKRETITVPMESGGVAWHSQVRDLAKIFLLRNAYESKFKLIANRETLLGTLPSTFLAHYRLHQKPSEQSATDLELTGLHPSASLQALNPDEPIASVTPTTSAAPCQNPNELRFVKQIEGFTDVLVSCGVTMDVDRNEMIVEVFTTKLPSERLFGAESVTSMVRKLQQCITDTVLHVDFFVCSQRTAPEVKDSFQPKSRPLHLKNALTLAQNLMNLAVESTAQEYSLLRRKSFDTKGISVTLFGSLVERLAGLLEPFQPCVLTNCAKERSSPLTPNDGAHSSSTGGNGGALLGGFPWRWLESMQTSLHSHKDHFFILCGFTLVEDTCDGKYKPVPPTRVHRANHPDFPYSMTTCVEAQCSVLEGQDGPGMIKSPSSELGSAGAGGGVMSPQAFTAGTPLSDAPKILLHLSLSEGIEAVVFNLRDSEQILSLCEKVISEVERKTLLMRDVLLQSMGLVVPTGFNEQSLAQLCCGDYRNIVQQQPLHIEREVVHRKIPTSRFHATTDDDPAPDRRPSSNAFGIIVAGLYNRGIIVNYVFPYDGAVKVLFDDGCESTVEQCKQTVNALIRDGLFVPDPSPLFGAKVSAAHHSYSYMALTGGEKRLQNFRIAEQYCHEIPHDALIANDYHRHLQRAHIEVEAKNAKSNMLDSMQKFQRLWSQRNTFPPAQLARQVIQLQMKSKQAYGSRVPEFSLRHEDAVYNPQDLILDQHIPIMLREGLDYCRPVDRILRSYVQHLVSVFPCAHIIDVDPSVPDFMNDSEIAARLRCRYGKVHSPVEREQEVTFTPHLYFAIIPIKDVLAHRGRTAAQTGAASDVTDGIFVVEVGFQVVNYALDFFVIDSGALEGQRGVTGETATSIAATTVKQKFMFSSVLYDLAVGRLLQCVKLFSAVLPGEQPLRVALKNLCKYYPTPPSYSLNLAHEFLLTDPLVIRLLPLIQKSASSLQNNTVGVVKDHQGSLVNFVVPPGAVLQRESTQELYSFAGLVVWTGEVPSIYVMLATEKETQSCSRVACRDLQPLLMDAKEMLIRHLLDSTEQLRVEYAWEKLMRPRKGKGPSSLKGAPQVPLDATEFSADDFALLYQRSASKTVMTDEFLGPICACPMSITGEPLMQWTQLQCQVEIFQNQPNRCSAPTNMHYLKLTPQRHALVAALQDDGDNSKLVACVLLITVPSTRSTALELSLELVRGGGGSGGGGGRSQQLGMDEDDMNVVEELLRLVVSAVWNAETQSKR